MSRTYRRCYNKNNEPKVYDYILGDKPWINHRTGRDITFKIISDKVDTIKNVRNKNLKICSKRLRRQAERHFLKTQNFDNNIIPNRFSDPWEFDLF